MVVINGDHRVVIRLLTETIESRLLTEVIEWLGY